MNIDNGLGTRPADKIYSQKQSQVPMSAQDLSRTKWNTGLVGAIMPIDVMKVIPNQTVKIDLTPNVELRNPFREDFKGNFRSYFHVYYMQNRHMWERWQNHIDRGESGDQTVEVPKLYYARQLTTHADAVTAGAVNANMRTSITPMSPADYMGIPISAFQKKVTYDSATKDVDNTRLFNESQFYQGGSDSGTMYDVLWSPKFSGGEPAGDAYLLKANALPFVMYNRVCRDYYFNKQLLKNNKMWYPDNPKDFILPFDCTKTTSEGYASNNYVNCVNRDTPLLPSEKLSDHNTYSSWASLFNPAITTTALYHDNGYYEKAILPRDTLDSTNIYGNAPILNKLHFRQFKGDMFTSGSIYPDLMASTDIPTMEDMELDFSESVLSAGTAFGSKIAVVVGNAGTGAGMLGADQALSHGYVKTALEKGKTISNVTMQALASLECWTRWRNRMARVTDNNFYNGVIKSNFGINPDDEDGTPVYIGGGYIDIGTTTVYNTGGAEDIYENKLLLGEKGATASGGGTISIPKFTAKDYGYIMVIQTIVPDVNYIGGLERHWNELLPNDEYYPDLNGLEPQATLCRELKFRGLDSTTYGQYNDEVFNYVPRYEHMKHRMNLVGGLSSLGSNFLNDRCRFMKRSYPSGTTSPILFNNYGVTMVPSNIDMSPFASFTEPQFNLECRVNVDSVAPMPIEVEPPESA